MARYLLIVSRVAGPSRGRTIVEQREFDNTADLGAYMIENTRSGPDIQFDAYTYPEPAQLQPKPPRAHFGARDRALSAAAHALAEEINATPGTDGTTATHEYVELDEGNAPFAYLDDLEARVGVNVDEARALYALSVAPDEEFPDLWHSVAARYPRLLP